MSRGGGLPWDTSGKSGGRARRAVPPPAADPLTLRPIGDYLTVELPANAAEHVPARAGANARIYALPLPAERRRAWAHLFHRLVVDGQIATAERLREALFSDGVTTADLAATSGSRGSKISDPEIRSEIREFTYRMLVPVVYHAGGSEGDRGYGMASSRVQVDQEVRQLLARADSIEEAADGVARSRPLPEAGEYEGCCHAHRVLSRSILKRLLRGTHSDAGATTSAELEEWLAAEAFSTADWTARGSGRVIRGATVREIIHHLRLEGAPILGDYRGYSIAVDDSEVERGAQHLRERASAIRERAAALNAAGALWWPRTEEEMRFRDQFLAGGAICARGASPQWARNQAARERSREAAAARRAQARQVKLDDHKAWAQKRMASIEREGAGYRNIHWRATNGQAIEPWEREMMEEYQAARRFVSRGELPTRPYAWAPAARRQGRTRRRGDTR